MCPLTKPDWMTLIEAEALTGMKSVLSVNVLFNDAFSTFYLQLYGIKLGHGDIQAPPKPQIMDHEGEYL